MKSTLRCVIVATAVFCGSMSQAATSVVGKIHRIYSHIGAGMVYIDLEGQPVLDGGGCQLYVYAAQMTTSTTNNDAFKTYIYPLLLAAKTQDADIKIIVQGCEGAYPKIVGAEFSPA